LHPASIPPFSDEVHQRVATIIFSIVLAIGLIMFYFKSTFNFDEKAGLLKKLAYLWIFLKCAADRFGIYQKHRICQFTGLDLQTDRCVCIPVLKPAWPFCYILEDLFQKNKCLFLSTMLRSFFLTFAILSWINFS
jgi:hypothetical protein